MHPQGYNPLMQKIRALFTRFPIYIFLCGLYPVMFLWMVNVTKVRPYVVPRSLMISMAFSLSVFLLVWMAVRPLRKAALLSAVWLVLFYLYGHIFYLIDARSLLGVLVGRHRFFFPLWLGIGLGLSFLVLRARSDLINATQILNAVFLGLTALALVQIGLALGSAQPQTLVVQAAAVPAQAETGSGPDVYYLLVDGYGREDLLKRMGQDNHAFIQQLEKLGFVVPACTQSNYNETSFSMSATLNMNYLDGLGLNYDSLVHEDYEKTLAPVVTGSAVRKAFHNLGYQWITFKTPFLFLDMPDSDGYVDAEKAASPAQKVETLNFQYLFIKTTLARLMVEWIETSPKNAERAPAFLVWLVSPSSLNPSSSLVAGRNYQQYKINLYNLDALEKIPDLPGKKFVYAHLLVTHQPFVFAPTGELRLEARDDIHGYLDQVTFLNTRLIPIVQTILKKSKTPPIIILQGDHSFADMLQVDRDQILNAYYLPGEGKAKIYPSITPVNTFRVVLNTYFGGAYPLLPDRSYLLSAGLPGGNALQPGTCVGQ